MNEANQILSYSLANQRAELNLIHQKLYEQLMAFTNDLNIPYTPKANSEDLTTYMNTFLGGFNRSSIVLHFQNIEEQNTENRSTNYEQILRANYALKDANNRLEDLISLVNQFEIKYKDHFNSLQEYHKSIEHALDVSLINGIAKENTVEIKKKEFSNKKENTTELIKAAIDIEELLDNKKSINHFAKII